MDAHLATTHKDGGNPHPCVTPLVVSALQTPIFIGKHVRCSLFNNSVSCTQVMGNAYAYAYAQRICLNGHRCGSGLFLDLSQPYFEKTKEKFARNSDTGCNINVTHKSYVLQPSQSVQCSTSNPINS